MTALQTPWLPRERADALGSINFMLVSGMATGKPCRAFAFSSQTGACGGKSFDDAPGLSRELRSALGAHFFGAVSATRGRTTRKGFKMLGTLLSMALDNRLSYCNSISLILIQGSHITVNPRHLFMVEVARESSTVRDSPP